MPVPCTSQAVLNATKLLFSEHGIPEKIRSDNGRYFDSACYKNFDETWGFDHITSSPHFPQSNGFVERAIGTDKSALKKAHSSDLDPDMALLLVRTTPTDAQMPCPAKLLYTRKIMSNLPVKMPNVRIDRDQVFAQLSERHELQKNYHDLKARDLPPSSTGRQVRIQVSRTGMWSPAKVVSSGPGPRSYIVNISNGSTLRHIRRHLLDIPQTAKDPVGVTPPTPRKHSHRTPEIS